MKSSLIPFDLGQSPFHADVQNARRCFLHTISFIEKAEILIEKDVARCHNIVRLRNHAGKMFVSFAERLELFVGDENVLDVALAFVELGFELGGIVFAFDGEHLKDFPTERVQLLDRLDHILLPVPTQDHGVQLELESEFAAPLTDLEKHFDVLSSAASDSDVCFFVEAIAANSKNVDVFCIFVQPFARDLGAVGDDRYRFQIQVFFTEFTEHAEFGWIKERFTSSEVDFLHPGVLEEFQAAFHVFIARQVAGFLSVETENTGFVALASKVIIDRYWNRPVSIGHGMVLPDAKEKVGQDGADGNADDHPTDRRREQGAYDRHDEVQD